MTRAADVAAAAEALRAESGAGVSEVVNQLVRRGLAVKAPEGDRFTQTVGDLGAPLLPLDGVADLLDVLDGPAVR